MASVMSDKPSFKRISVAMVTSSEKSSSVNDRTLGEGKRDRRLREGMSAVPLADHRYPAIAEGQPQRMAQSGYGWKGCTV
jgi:hypothetical protein